MITQQKNIRGQFDTIKKNISRGDCKIISEKTGYHIATILSYVNGTRNNLTTGATILAEFKKLISEREKLINA